MFKSITKESATDKKAAQKYNSIAWMINHGIAPNLLMLLLIVGGLVMSFIIRKEYMPDVTLDRVGIVINYPGASPDEIESAIALPIEAIITPLEGIKEVKTIIRTGRLFIRAELEGSDNAQKIFQDVQQAITRINTFPTEMDKPRIFLASKVRDVMEIVVHGDLDAIGIKRLSEEIRDRILQSVDISKVTLHGTAKEEIHIDISQHMLNSLQTDLSTIAKKISLLTKEQSTGTIKSNSGNILVKVDERLLWADEFAQLSIMPDKNGGALQLKDVAKITEGFADSKSMITFDGQLAASLRIYRVGEQSPDKIGKAIEAMWPELEALLPPTAGLTIIDDDAKNYQKRLSLLLKNAFFGLLLVLFFMSLFLDFRLAFWVVAGIPSAFLGAILFLPSFGISINMVSMFGFIIALGIVVDDAIIAGENIYTHMQEGMPFSSAAQLGAQEVAKPLTFAILTNIIAFIPLLFLPGFMKLMFGAIPVVVILCFVISWLEALFILPAHLARINQKTTKTPGNNILSKSAYYFSFAMQKAQQNFDKALESFIQHPYLSVLKKCLSWPALTLSIASLILLWVLGYAFSGKMGFSLMPKMEGRWVKASIVLPEDFTLMQMNKVKDKLESNAKEMLSKNEIEQAVISIRSEIFENTLEVGLLLVDSEEREISSVDIKSLWREQSKLLGKQSLNNLGKLRFGSARKNSNSQIEASITLELRHNDTNVLSNAAIAAQNYLQSDQQSGQYITSITNSMEQGNPQWSLTLNENGQSLGFNGSDVAKQLRSSLYGARVTRQHRGQNEVTVLVRLPLRERQSSGDIENLLISTGDGGFVPLNEIANISKTYSPATIKRYKNQRIEQLYIEVEDETKTPQVNDFIHQQLTLRLTRQFAGLKVSMSGDQKEIAQSVSKLELGTLFALTGIYILLAIAFKSYLQPLLIMAIIPFGAVGAILGHLLLGFGLSIVSLMGMLALAGVVINDSLIMVEYANKQVTQGHKPKQAIINAGMRRFRPILLTTLTTFGGLAPMVFETSRQAQFIVPMAVSLGFGILFTTFICLLVLPCLYLITSEYNDIKA
ncbi:efflux RND transporter permease subunit [Colwellia psychrerythraea]|uniref:AcrB/AcrD/AcrF family protein n=1 Tax=Colwellia psychrerythraea (strain 34H / ATCC BAA-681) TaxID=167879 RepID=Q482B6_COLP3|nr:efflux RND transporter permease subunit [Colwellia psychrerythraea]AAZ26221.1 AcrB/AcrD/AcrF family protein [Colwellia psychrerythraea 34H]